MRCCADSALNKVFGSKVKGLKSSIELQKPAGFFFRREVTFRRKYKGLSQASQPGNMGDVELGIAKLADGGVVEVGNTATLDALP